MANCESLGIIAPYDLSQYLTFSNIENETSPAPFDPNLDYVTHTLATYAGAKWRFLGDLDDPATQGQYPSDGRVKSVYYAPLPLTIKGRTIINRWYSYLTFQKGELTYKYVYVTGVGYVYSRYRSLTAGNRNNALPSTDTDNTHWEFADNIRDNYTYLEIHDSSTPKQVGKVVWVPDPNRYPTHPTYKYLYGRAWIAISDVPAANTSPGFYPPDQVAPPQINTEDDNSDQQQYWEFVALMQRLRFLDVSPYTQSEQPGSIVLELNFNLPATDIVFLNADADTIETEVYNSVNDSLVNQTNNEMLKPIVNLWEFREPRKLLTTAHISNLPFYPSTRHVYTITKDIAKIGAIIVGQRFEVGDMQYGSGTGASALGGLETDNFETLGVKKGRAIDSMDYITHVEPAKYNSVYEYLKSIKGNIVYVITPQGVEESGGLGYLKDFDFVIAQPEYYVLTINLEGITDYELQ